MSRLFLDSKAGASSWTGGEWFPAAPTTVDLPRTLGEPGQLVRGRDVIMYFSLAGTGLEYDPVWPADHEFERQRDAFLAIPEADLLRFAGEFVLSRDGRIVDHDRDLVALTSRSGTAPVYITRAGEDLEMGIDTPFLD
jgi:hypothetical protein